MAAEQEMESGNSGSMGQSSSDGEEEYDDSGAAAAADSSLFSHHHHLQQQQQRQAYPFSTAPPPPPPPPPYLDPQLAGGYLARSHYVTPPLLNPEGVWCSTARSDPNPSTNLQSVQAAPPSTAGRNPRKRTRASRRAPTTVLTTDTSNFRAMVQEFTGIPASPFASSTSSSLLFPGRARLDQLFGSNRSLLPAAAQQSPVPYLQSGVRRPAPFQRNNITSSQIPTTTPANNSYHLPLSDLGLQFPNIPINNQQLASLGCLDQLPGHRGTNTTTTTTTTFTSNVPLNWAEGLGLSADAAASGRSSGLLHLHPSLAAAGSEIECRHGSFDQPQ